MSRIFTTLLFLFVASSTFCQVKFSDAEVLITTRHTWRGSKFGTAPAIEPSVTFVANKLSLNFWSSVTFNNSYSEIDLTPSYQFKEFQLTLLDYYCPVVGEENQFLNFKKGESRHSLELTIDNYSVEKRRIKWLVGVLLLGDKNPENDKPYYSTYTEFKYPFTVCSIDVEPLVGLTPFRGLYAEKFAMVNAGISFSKDLDLKLPFSVPLSLSFISNPNARQSFVTFAAGIAF